MSLLLLGLASITQNTFSLSRFSTFSLNTFHSSASASLLIELVIHFYSLQSTTQPGEQREREKSFSRADMVAVNGEKKEGREEGRKKVHILLSYLNTGASHRECEIANELSTLSLMN